MTDKRTIAVVTAGDAVDKTDMLVEATIMACEDLEVGAGAPLQAVLMVAREKLVIARNALTAAWSERPKEGCDGR